MATITLTYNARNSLAQSIINSIKNAGVFLIKEEKSPYNQDFVKEVLDSRNSKGVKIKKTNQKLTIN